MVFELWYSFKIRSLYFLMENVDTFDMFIDQQVDYFQYFYRFRQNILKWEVKNGVNTLKSLF